jgi:hypothetical protein
MNVGAEPHRHHVLLKEFAQRDAEVEAGRDDVSPRVVDGELQPDVGVGFREPAEHRLDQRGAGEPWQAQAHGAGRRVAQTPDLADRGLHLLHG